MESIKINSNEIVLLGTSHISPKSVKDINNFVQKNNPDIICI
ncbi:TraB family protein, partial [Candidatus Woesearchaeota archaeon]|nr:TraB family protein [Candidatus Woesearchaeota archaeon]